MIDTRRSTEPGTKQPDKAATDLSRQLRNIGPKLAARMIEAGIDAPEKLGRLGAKQAFAAMYADGDSYGDFNAAYLYALEGAIRDCDWSDVPADVKEDFKRFAQDLQQAGKG